MKKAILISLATIALLTAMGPICIPPPDPCWPASSSDVMNPDGTWTCNVLEVAQ